MFYPQGGGQTTFKFPEERKLRIEGCAERRSRHAYRVRQRSQALRLLSAKDGNIPTHRRTLRRPGFVHSEQVGIESVELGIYNSATKTAEVFSAKGDSGSLVWHTRNGKLASWPTSCRSQQGGSTATMLRTAPLAGTSWKRFKYADFYRTTWSAQEQHQRLLSFFFFFFGIKVYFYWGVALWWKLKTTWRIGEG